MFGFSKKFKPLKDYGDEWSILEGIHKDKPIFVRFRLSFKDAVGHPDYPFQIGIAIPLVDPTKAGLPSNEDLVMLNKIEDKLCEELGDEVAFVLSISTNGMREFVFYARDWQPERFEKIVNKVNAHFPSRELQFMMQQDPKWDTFKNFL